MSLDNSFRLDGRVAFLSGAAGHLGREMAFALGRAGASLILNGRNAKRLEAFASELGKARIEAECAPFDMMDFAKSRAFFAKLSRLHILINNAVTMTVNGNITDDYDDNLVVNGSFESGLAGWTIGGTDLQGYPPVAITYNSATAYPTGAFGEAVGPPASCSYRYRQEGERKSFDPAHRGSDHQPPALPASRRTSSRCRGGF